MINLSNFKEIINDIPPDELSKNMLDAQFQRDVIQVINQNLSDRGIAPIVEKTLSVINIRTLSAVELKPLLVFFTKNNTDTTYKWVLSKLFWGLPSKLMIEAAETGNADLVRLFIENGANVDDAIKVGFNLYKAVVSNLFTLNYEIARLLIDNGFDVRLKDSENGTILHYVSLCGYADLALLCLDKGASLNIQDQYGYTPLHYACSIRNVDTARLLIKRGAKLEIKENGEMTPLLMACRRGHFELAKLLIENGASLDAKDADGFPALIQVCNNWNPEFVRFLIEKGANLKSKNPKGDTILHVACFNKHTDLAHLCLDHGADINAQNNSGNTPLHLARTVDIARLLLEKEADVHIQDETGHTALHFACTQGSLELVKTLIEHGAIVSERNQNGESPLHFACQMGKADIARLLIEKGAKVNEINRHDMLVFFEKFIKDIYDRAVGNDKEIPQTPLQLACESRNIETIIVLLENQADINQADLHGMTPLHIVCQKKCERIALELIERGANPHLPNKFNRTPLDIAKEHKLLEVAPPETDAEIEAFLFLKELNDLEKLLQQALTEQEKIFSFLPRINLHIKKAERVRKRSGSSKIQDWIDRTKPRMEAMRNQFHEILKNNPFSSSELPDEFKCPIGLDLIKDAVYLINPDGNSLFPHAFDKKNIELWHETQKSMNRPLTIPVANVKTFDRYISADEIFKERAAEIESKLIF